METNLILKYFDVIYTDKYNRHSIKLKLKSTFTSNKQSPRRGNGMPFSGVEKEYYIHYLGEDVGVEVYHARKKLCSKNKLFEWYISTFNPLNADEMYNEIQKTNTKISKALKSHYDSPAGDVTRLKLKERSARWADYIGELNAAKWHDSDWRDLQIKNRKESGMYERISMKAKDRMLDEQFFKKFKEACNSPQRIKKISDSAKKMWQDVKMNDPEKVKNMIHSGSRKKFNHDGVAMNSIEFIMASLLKSLNLDFEYESVHNIDTNTYVPDFYIKDYNLVIECFGDYWHANPKYYTSTNTIFRHPVNRIYERDGLKRLNFENSGYQYIVFWEYDLRNNLEEIKQQLCSILKKK